MKETFDLPKIQAEISRFIEARDWEQFHSIKNLSMALNVESGELLEIFQWMKEADSNAIGSDPKLKEKLEDELADVLFFLIRIAQKSSVNLESAILKKIKKNGEKYPADLVKGSSKKYSEY